MIKGIIELVIFKLNQQYQDQQVINAAEKINPVLKNMPGFIKRDLGRTEDGKWTDVVYWESLEQAQAAAKKVMKMEECQDFFGMISEKMNTCQQQQNRNPEGPQSEQPDKKTGYMGSEDAEQIMNLSCSPGIVDRGVCGVVGQQTDQCKYNKEKKNNSKNFFAHNFLYFHYEWQYNRTASDGKEKILPQGRLDF